VTEARRCGWDHPCVENHYTQMARRRARRRHRFAICMVAILVVLILAMLAIFA
jgi:hypothetical protein